MSSYSVDLNELTKKSHPHESRYFPIAQWAMENYSLSGASIFYHTLSAFYNAGSGKELSDNNYELQECKLVSVMRRC